MTLNETITETIKNIDYDTWVQVTQNPIFLICVLITFFLPLLIYFFIMFTARAKSPSGNSYSKTMWHYPNSWYAFVIWMFIQSMLFLVFIIFPFWLEWIN